MLINTPRERGLFSLYLFGLSVCAVNEVMALFFGSLQGPNSGGGRSLTPRGPKEPISGITFCFLGYRNNKQIKITNICAYVHALRSTWDRTGNGDMLRWRSSIRLSKYPYILDGFECTPYIP